MCPTLFHWDLPQALEELGGFRNRDTVSWFGDYAALMVRELGDRVHMWSTFNEPWCYAYLGHASGVHAPGLTDPHAAVTVAHHELLAHGLALQTMRAERDDLQLGVVINPSNIVSDAQRPADDAQVRLIDAIHNRWWFDAMLRNNYPADLLESYGPLADAIRAGDTETISQPLVRLRDDYPGLPPIYITENGCAYDDPIIDGRCADPRRIDYLDQHLRAIRHAIDAGVDIRGYYQWTLMDNFEWSLGYDKRFGLVHVDFDTLDRTPRDSASWYRDVISRNGLE